MPKGYGDWSASSIYKLGDEENPPVGEKLLQLSVSKLVGLPVDGYIIINSKSELSSEKFLTDLKKNPLTSINYFSSSKTNLSPRQILDLIGYLSSVRTDKIAFLDLEQSDITESKLLADSTRVLGVNTVKLDLFIREKMGDKLILDEEIPLAVFNATSHPGLAQEAARVLTNLGGNVVILSNTNKLEDKTKVVINSSVDEHSFLRDKRGVLESSTFQKTVNFFAPDCLKGECVSEDSKALNSRALINVIIGEDYYTFWNKK